MNKLARIISASFCLLTVTSCSQVLQNVVLDVPNNDLTPQENFQVEEKTLTLATAKIANQDPYVRNVIKSGRGNSAGPILENDALYSNFPKDQMIQNYKVGVGDEVTYTISEENQQNYRGLQAEFPISNSPKAYIIGNGDELTLLRFNETETASNNILGVEREGLKIASPNLTQKSGVVATSGRVGPDGSILLLEVGRIEAAGKTLNEVQSEVRNILIRDGLSPRFQLDISGFGSQKAILTVNLTSSDRVADNNLNSKVVTLTDRVATLRDILAISGLGVKTSEKLLITIRRGANDYKMTMRDVYDTSRPSIIIEDGDAIFVNSLSSNVSSGTARVMTDGTLIIPQVGKIIAAGKTINQLKLLLTEKLTSTPEVLKSIDVDVIGFASQTVTIHLSNGVVSDVSDPAGLSVSVNSKNNLLSDALTEVGVKVNNDAIIQIKLVRDKKTYTFNFEELLLNNNHQIFMLPNDQVFVDRLPYRDNKVFALGGIKPKIINIRPEMRETLADALFSEDGVIESEAAQRSDVYLLRGTSPIRAYRLDAQSPTRLIVADAMELRPNDILYVSEQPIISFNRALERIIPLRTLIADIANASN